MTDHTPTPWRIGDNSLGVYPIFAKQGPLTVQPAKAFSETDAAFIVKAVNNQSSLKLALQEIAARARFELDHPTDMRDTAFSLIEKTALKALEQIK